MSLFDNFPHIANYRLSIWPSPLCFTTTLSGTPQRGDRLIHFTGGVPIKDIFAGYTLEVDADAGTSRPVARVRIRDYDAGASTFLVAENAINWQAGQQIRVYREMQPWSIKPRIQVVGGVPVFLQDYDIVYTNQNQIVKPVVNMGGHYAGPASSRIYYTGADSWDPQGDSLTTYTWFFEGGTPASYSGVTPGYVQYNTPGAFYTTLTLTNSHGAQQLSTRFQIIGQEQDQEWGIDSLDGTVDTGYTMKCWSRTDFGGLLKAGALCVVYGEESFGGVLFNDGNRPEIKFVGYITKRSVKWNVRFARWDFELSSLSAFADKLDVYDTSLQFRETSNRWQWWKYYRLTLDKGIAFHLSWHTNLLDIADFYPTGDARYTQNIDIGRGGPFSNIRQLLNSAAPGWFGCDVQGAMRACKDPNLMEEVDRPNPSWFTLNPAQYREEPYVVDADPFEVSHVGAGGFAFSGATGTSTPYLSAAPMDAADDYGKPADYQGLILTPGSGQDELNKISGHMFARDNNQFADTNWPLVGNFRPFIDLYPRKRVLVNTPTGPLTWSSEVFYVSRISHKYDPKTKMMLTDLGMSRETIGLPGVTVTVPIPENVQEPPAPPPPPPPVIPPKITTNLVGMAGFVSGNVTGSHITYSSFSIGGQPVWANLALPSGFTGPIVQSHYWDSILYISRDGSRLIVAGVRVSDGKSSFWECTNWNSIRNNPTPPAPTWAERLTYDVTTYGGFVIATNGTFTNGQGEFQADNSFAFSCSWNSAWSIGIIAVDGSVSVSNKTSASNNYGVGNNCYNDNNLVGGTSYVRNLAGTVLYSFTGTVFGTTENSSPYRNDLGGGALTSYARDGFPGANKVAIRHSGGYFDLGSVVTNDWVIFRGTPRAAIVTAGSNISTNAWKSTDGGANWSVFATWNFGALLPIKADADEGFLWGLYTAVTSGNVPVRLYDADGNVLDDMTGNWWTERFPTDANTSLKSFRGWYAS